MSRTRNLRERARLAERLEALFRAQATNLRQGMASLTIASVVNLLAGLILGFMTDTLARLPGLLVLVPAAIAMRGNIFGALGSRLGTAVRTGQWSGEGNARPSPDSVVGQNVAAAAALTLHLSVAVALLAWAISPIFGLETISALQFLTISVVGGVLASAIVLVITIAVAVLSVRREWDIDNVSAPIVTAVGDLVTVPALWLAALLLPTRLLPEMVGVLTLITLAWSALHFLRAGRLRTYRTIVRQSLPILLAAGTVDVIAGITIDERIDRFLVTPALLILIPPLLADAGALGAMLSARLSSKLHLGSMAPRAWPERVALGDIGLAYALSIPAFSIVALGATLLSTLTGLARPDLLTMTALTLLAGLMATTGAVFAGYYGAVISFRFGLDPDTYGIPAVTASMDLLGVLALLASMFILGMAG